MKAFSACKSQKNLENKQVLAHEHVCTAFKKVPHCTTFYAHTQRCRTTGNKKSFQFDTVQE